MAPTLREAENILKNVKIEENVLERIAEMLVTKIDNAHLIAEQKTCEAVWVILTEAASMKKPIEDVVKNIGEMADPMTRIFEKFRPKLVEQMKSIRWNYDEIVDFDVKVTRINKSSLHGDQTPQKTSVALKVLPAGTTEIITCHVDFDEAQLEDFIWKLQEAVAMKSRIQKKACT